ncbi:class I SAM-dependent methyltransferase [Desulfurococcaceae archaeon MEX13E-LK6-19]|nr:class I SAM-dependent methyltransferase [Desulfurococcaceae archaeon MEX13E-LK6-19]
MEIPVLVFIDVLSSIVIERKDSGKIIVPSKCVREELSRYLSDDRLSIDLVESRGFVDADIVYTSMDYINNDVATSITTSFNGVLIIDEPILGVYKDPFLVKKLVSQGFARSWIPVGKGIALLARRGFDNDFLRGTIEVYRESFIKGPNPIHYNTAYLLYIMTKFACRYYSKGIVVEVGTGRGFSTLWLAHACMETGCRLVSYDVSAERIESARMFLKKLGLIDHVELVCSDARNPRDFADEVNLLFIDGKKDEYLDYLKAFEQYLIKGAVILAHNTISNSDLTANYIKHVYKKYKSITVLSDPAGVTISVKTTKQ